MSRQACSNVPHTQSPSHGSFVGRDLKALCLHAAGACILRVGAPTSPEQGKQGQEAGEEQAARAGGCETSLRISPADFDQALTQVLCHPWLGEEVLCHSWLGEEMLAFLFAC